MTRKKISSGEQFTTGESSHAHNTTVSDTVDDTSTSCSQGHCIENLTDTLHCVGTQDEIRALEIQARRLEIEAKLLETREKLRLLKSNVKETDSILPEASSKTGALERVEPLEYVTFCDDMFSLPKTELSYFNGDPSQYWSFVTDFETNVARKVRDAGAKLTYLKYYCRGPAREAIEGCSMLPPEQGYKVALENLKSMFGDEHQVTRALLGTLKNEIKNVGDSPIRWQLLSIKLKDCKLAFDHMGNVEYLNAYETLESLIKCFSAEIREKWVKLSGKLKAGGLVASFADLIQLIEEQANFRNNIYSHLTFRQKPESNLNTKNVYLTAKVKANEFTLSCPMCGECHQLDECSKFMSSPPEVRLNLVKQKGRCYNCLKGKHLSKDCRFKKPCRSLNCNKYHHKLLHKALSFENKPDSKVVAVTTCEWDVHLGVIPVKVQTPGGLIVTNALLDPGSQITLVKDSLASKLNTKCSDIRIKIATVSGSSIIDTNELQLSIQSLDGSEVIEVGKAYVVPSLPFEMTPHIDRRNLENWEHLRDLDLPTTFNGDVTILIGSDVPEVHWILDQRIGGKKEPFAIRSKLGWILRGPINNQPSSSYVSCVIDQSRNSEKMIEHVYNHDFEDVTSSNLLSQDSFKAPDDQMVCNLVMAKAMVTSKTVSIPTLESTATTLVKSTFRLKWNSIKHFTDCKIIINYIRNTSSRFCTFMANKITEIRNCFSPDKWNHVIGFKNPADYTSSGLRLHSSFLTKWFNEPESLTQLESTCPVQPHDLPLDNRLIELKSKDHDAYASACSPMNKLTTYFSCWLKMTKSVARLVKFKKCITIMYCKQNHGCSMDAGLLKAHDVKRIDHDVIKLIKRYSSSRELDFHTSCGNERQILPESSRLQRLHPILVGEIPHMNDCFCNSDFVISFKLPINLLNGHSVVEILMDYYHRLGHFSTSETPSSIQIRYWILKYQKTVRNIIVEGKRLNERLCTQLMSPLAHSCLKTGNSFSSIDVDYFRLFLISRGRTLEKRYDWLFTQYMIRTVYLEIMSTTRSSANWPLGLVIDGKASEDNMVRETAVKTSKRLIRKYVRKSVLLEGQDDYG